jgi:arylsulfatase A
MICRLSFLRCPQQYGLRRFWAIVLVTCLFLGAVAFARAEGERETRPVNLVLIMADDMGYECVGANGGGSYQTPNLDRMAEQGMRFTNCHSQPLCTPSRVQIMTGRYNSENYVRFGFLDPQETTFANALRQAGYATCIVGKWQLDGGFDAPDHFGFDEYCLWQLTRRPNRYPNPGLEINGREVDYRDGEYGPDLVSDYGCDFIERHRDEPFLLYYPMILPHWPFEPTPDSSDWDPTARREDKREKGANRTSKKHFADMVAYTDKMAGKIIEKIDALGLSENTLILFTGDNGTMDTIYSLLDGKEIRGGKRWTLDVGTHVPLIARWPGKIAEGTVETDLIDFSDFYPTLLDVADVAPDESKKLDGRSFLPQLLGKEGNPRRWIYCWYYRNGDIDGKYRDKQVGEFARTEHYKYYRNGEFYNTAEDPREEQPLEESSLTEKEQDIRAMLKEVVRRYAREPST